MSDENPYSVSRECTGGANAVESLPYGAFRIDGDKIVCGDAVQLPPVCIITGAKDDLVQHRCVAQFGSWRLVVRQRSVNCLFYVDRALLRKKRILRATATAGVLLGVVMMVGGPFLVSGQGAGGLFLTGLLILTIGFVLAQFSEIRLWINRHRGHQYWIEGIKQPFFASLETLLKTAQTETAGP